MMECKRKKRFAQQLIEFLLVAPFIMIILGILTEYAYALYVRMVVNEGLRQVSTTIYKDIKPLPTGQQVPLISNAVRDGLIAYLDENNIATIYQKAGSPDKNAVSLEMVTLGETTIFVATYEYIPAITFPQVYFHFLPEKLNFILISAVPTTFLSDNNGFDKSITSAVLDGAWWAASFSNPSSDFEAHKIGVLNDTGPGQSEMAFLVQVDNLPLGGTNYAIVYWGGNVAQSGGNYKIANSNGSLYNCHYIDTYIIPGKAAVGIPGDPGYEPPVAPKTVWGHWAAPTFSTSVKSYLSGYSSFVFAHGSGVPLNASGGSISTSKWTTVRAKAVAIVDDSGNSLGNYDKLGTMTYQVDATGGKVIVYNPSLDNVNIIK